MVSSGGAGSVSKGRSCQGSCAGLPENQEARLQVRAVVRIGFMIGLSIAKELPLHQNLRHAPQLLRS